MKPQKYLMLQPNKVFKELSNDKEYILEEQFKFYSLTVNINGIEHFFSIAKEVVENNPDFYREIKY